MTVRVGPPMLLVYLQQFRNKADTMQFTLQPWQLYFVILAGWINP